MERSKALTALLAMQSKPVTKVSSPEVAPRQSGYCGALGGESLSRVRDRMEIQANAPTNQPEKLSWDESVKQEQTRLDRLGAEANARRQRDAQEREAARERERTRKIEDERCLREAQERQQQVIEQNMIRREVRQILQDATAEEVQAVLKLTREWKTDRFAPSYLIALEQVRAKQSK